LKKDDDILAFRDINPQAPTHLLLIPKRHIATINDTHSQDEQLLGKLILQAKILAQNEGFSEEGNEGFSEEGYRLVFNVNSGGGQEVYHIHLHLLGGRSMHWPPG